MARLFVANCTAQFQEVHFRLDFHDTSNPTGRVPPAKRQTIPPGRQVCLGGDLHMSQIEEIVKQLQPYGLIGAMEISKTRRFVPYVFNVNQAVKASTIHDARKLNNSIMVRDGRDLREKAAVVVNELVANTVAHEFAERGIPADPKQDVEIEIEQLEQSENGEKLIEEGYRIDAKAPQTKTQQQRKSRAKNS